MGCLDLFHTSLVKTHPTIWDVVLGTVVLADGGLSPPPDDPGELSFPLTAATASVPCL